MIGLIVPAGHSILIFLCGDSVFLFSCEVNFIIAQTSYSCVLDSVLDLYLFILVYCFSQKAHLKEEKVAINNSER